jgi:MSHA biogenesis protein MshE
MNKKVRIGDLLVDKGLITEAQLREALAEQAKTGRAQKLGGILIRQGLLTEAALLALLSQQMNLPVVDLQQLHLDPAVTKKLPEAYARRYRALLLAETDNDFTVAMSDPLDIAAMDELQRILGLPIKQAIISENELLRALDLVYRRTDEITNYAEALDEELTQSSVADLDEAIGEVDAPVVKLLHSVFEDAVQVSASDVHIEPGEDILRIRLRVDGVLQEQIVKERQIASAIASRLKLMASLDISEKRRPQDGRFTIKVRKKVLDIRLSTLPTPYGESVVMRLLDQSSGQLDLKKVGMTKEMLKTFREILRQPHGVILVTGPTGSGKSTTLYGVLNEINEPGKKIITAEDPIEYRLPRIIQTQVNEKIKLTFASVLRAAMRQDPDIILIGEMRDEETASVAIRAALTGHLVFSTLHTNDSASSAFRLMDMGVEGFLVAATLRAVLAQRLARKICKSCREKYTLDDSEKNWLKAIGYTDLANQEFWRGKGCTSCNDTGYHGREGIFELLVLNAGMMDALRKNDTAAFEESAKAALKGGFLLDGAIEAASKGITTLTEAMRIAGEG